MSSSDGIITKQSFAKGVLTKNLGTQLTSHCKMVLHRTWQKMFHGITMVPLMSKNDFPLSVDCLKLQ